jgi:hypothetical protein
MAAPRKTVAQLLLDVRTNLDENTASFWTDTQLISYIDQAQHVVWTEVKKLKGDDYFDIERNSTDGTVTILTENYDCASFAIAASTTNYTLPPDVAEVKLIDCITSGYEHVRFVFKDRAHPDFRAARQIVETLDPSVGFYCDLMGERTLVIAPKSNRALDLRLSYMPILGTLTATTDTLQVPHALWLAVLDIATKRAQMKDRDSSFIMWEEEAQATIARFFGSNARQTSDPMIVQGLFE